MQILLIFTTDLFVKKLYFERDFQVTDYLEKGTLKPTVIEIDFIL